MVDNGAAVSGSSRPRYGAKNSDRNMKKYNGLQLDEIITEVACFATHPDWFLPGAFEFVLNF